jgi:hypothetical protein
MELTWKKISTVVGALTGILVLGGAGYKAYDYYTPKAMHEALASDVKENYVQQDELLAINKNVQQSNYDFWIYRLKSEINALYEEWRKETDPVKKQQIMDQINEKKADVKYYQEKLHELQGQ